MDNLLGLLPLLVMPLLAGIGIALISGPLGTFVVWRRMAYFGDTLAHSALLGVALGVLADWNLTVSMILAGLIVSVALWRLQHRSTLASDTLLGILSHSALALGLVCVSLLSSNRINLFGYLFGDLLTVGSEDLLLIYLAGGLCFAVILVFWRPLVMAAIDEDLARVEGLPVEKLRLLLMVLMATVVALAMKLVGVLLITALLIIPAASARRLTRSPEAMAAVAAIMGVIAVAGGLFASVLFDLPAGPAVVLAAAVLFLGSLTKRA
ncbi:iron chelate uptake ABC transporter family permease subunit [Teredinibacter purpureus]|uniref:iron chelate uptake ABC transporter family permease subunit n=1 Tax=Teredinibacter purpureus TaxID=2731756 RepID=UPI0005F88FF6|nr:iron chelate uptake ABC transporter family permease subunit [Teredinibacter purpureus]